MEIILFSVVVTAMLGAFLFLPVIKKKKAPKFAIYAHGSFAIISVCLLSKEFFFEGNLHLVSMILFALAAINGIYMFIISEIQKRTIPPALLVLHANLAVIALISLLYFMWR
jgi:hypothetical protein